MIVPERVTARWIATLGNGQLMAVESRLHTEFIEEENREKRRRGIRYVLLKGPEGLVNAWLRWSMVSNETRTRGLLVRHRVVESRGRAAALARADGASPPRTPDVEGGGRDLLDVPPHDPAQRGRAEKTTVRPRQSRRLPDNEP